MLTRRDTDFLSDLQVILLSLCRSERTCREIADRYHQKTKIDIADGTLYTTLTRMAFRGLLEERPSIEGEDLRMRWYRISPKGSEALRRASLHARKMVRILAAAG